METIKIKDVFIVDYSEKAIAIQGNTKPIKELLKTLGAHYNQNLVGGPGWIASKKKRNLFKTKIENYFNNIEK